MLESRLSEIVAEIAPAVQEAVTEGADLVVDSAKARVPVATGALQRAIHTEPDPDTGGMLVLAGGTDPETGADVFYGHIVEHGGTYTPARPFLVPALEENAAKIEELIGDALRRATR